VDREVKELREEAIKSISQNRIVIYGKPYDPFTDKAKALFEKIQVHEKTYKYIDVSVSFEKERMIEALWSITGQKSVPNIFILGQHIGGLYDLQNCWKNGKLTKMLDSAGISHSGIEPKKPAPKTFGWKMTLSSKFNHTE